MVTGSPARLPALHRSNALRWLVDRPLLWALFFGIALGLGYPTLNRYDPSTTPGVWDAELYSRMALEGSASVPPPWRYRMTVPLLVRPIARAAEGRLGSWSGVWFGFLLVNAGFVATAALLLVGLATRLGVGAGETGLGILLLLLDFSIPNFHLAGLVDSLELLVLVAVVRSVVEDRWFLLPPLVAVGTVAKETVLPLAIAFGLGWLICRAVQDRMPREALAWLVFGAVAGLTALAINQGVIDARFVLPWNVVVAQVPSKTFLHGFFDSLTSNSVIYTFGWLVPLAAFSLRRFPAPFVSGSALAMTAALLIGSWATIEGNVGRPMFNIGAPLLTLAAGCTLLALLRGDTLASVGDPPADDDG